MDHVQALEVLNNLRSVLYEKGEITVTPKVYRQVEEAVLEISMALDRQEEQNKELGAEVAELRTERDRLRLQNTIQVTQKKVKKKK